MLYCDSTERGCPLEAAVFVDLAAVRILEKDL